MFFLFLVTKMLNYPPRKTERCIKMKKIIAFVLSASMCLSLLTVLTPAFAYEQEEQVAVMRVPDPDEDPEKIPFGPQDDTP